MAEKPDYEKLIKLMNRGRDIFPKEYFKMIDRAQALEEVYEVAKKFIQNKTVYEYLYKIITNDEGQTAFLDAVGPLEDAIYKLADQASGKE